MKKHFIYFLISLNFILNTITLGAVPEINVKIGSRVEHLKITSKSDFVFHFLRGEREHKSTQRKLEFDCNFTLSERNKTVLFASLMSKNNKTDLIYGKKGFGRHIKLATSSQRGCDVIQSIKINHYLESLLSKEMNGSWPVEALKAQAVAARSYAMDKIQKSKGSNYNIISGEIHQVSGSSEDVTERTKKAVKDTFGEVLINNEKKLVPGFYHAECGGKTFDPIDIWSGHMFDYQGTTCPYCHKKTKKKKWKRVVSDQKMLGFLLKYYGVKIDTIKSFEIINPEKIHVKINSKNYIFLPSDFRKNLLSLNLKSNNFILKRSEKNNFLVEGAGRGHGVGMCQLGALKMAELGFGYKEILSFYYPKLKLEKVY